MIRPLLLAPLLAAAPAPQEAAPATTPYEAVDPFIGTGGELRFTMQAQPSRAWGKAASARRYSMSRR